MAAADRKWVTTPMPSDRLNKTLAGRQSDVKWV
jgi:hypothetical protein